MYTDHNHNGFHRFTEIGQSLLDKYIFNVKKTFQVELVKWNNPSIWNALSEGNGFGQCSVWII